jgi:hypothetical protein
VKQKDLIIIVAVAVVVGIFSFVLSNFLFSGKKAYNLTAPTVNPISANFQLPDSTYFNSNSLDPTQDITIGGTTNTAPFQTQQ